MLRVRWITLKRSSPRSRPCPRRHRDRLGSERGLATPLEANLHWVRAWRAAGIPEAEQINGMHVLRHTAASVRQGRGVASDATFRVQSEDGAVRDTGHGPARRRSLPQIPARPTGPVCHGHPLLARPLDGSVCPGPIYRGRSGALPAVVPGAPGTAADRCLAGRVTAGRQGGLVLRSRRYAGRRGRPGGQRPGDSRRGQAR